MAIKPVVSAFWGLKRKLTHVKFNFLFEFSTFKALEFQKMELLPLFWRLRHISTSLAVFLLNWRPFWNRKKGPCWLFEFLLNAHTFLDERDTCLSYLWFIKIPFTLLVEPDPLKVAWATSRSERVNENNNIFQKCRNFAGNGVEGYSFARNNTKIGFFKIQPSRG